MTRSLQADGAPRRYRPLNVHHDGAVKAEVLQISTNDGEDLDDVVLDSDEVDVWITVLAGPAGGPGEDSFQLRVRTPGSLTKELDQCGPLHGRHTVVVATWDPRQIRSFVNRLFKETEGRDWNEVGEKLSRLGHWEFEDYEP